MYKKGFYIFLLFSALYLSFCKKDTKDEDPPVATFIAPYEGSVFTATDTFNIEVECTDNNQLVSAQLYIVNDKYVKAGDVVDIQLSGTKQKIKFDYPIKKDIETSGNYFITCRLSDGENTDVTYYKIYIHALPKKYLGVFSVAYSAGVTKVYKTDSNHTNTINIHNFNSDYGGSAISNYYQQLYVCGKSTGNLNTIITGDNALSWSKPATPAGSMPYFTNVQVYNKTPFVSYYDGNIYAYNNYGTGIYHSMLNTGYPEKCLVSGDRLLIEEKYINSSATAISITTLSNAQFLGSGSIDISLTGMFIKDKDYTFLFGNKNNQAQVRLFNNITRLTNSPKALPAGKLLSVARVDADTYLLAMSDKKIYMYYYPSSNIIPLINGISAYHMAYNELRNEIAVGTSDKKISIYGYSSGSLKNSQQLSDSIVGMHLWFNK